MKLKVDDLLLVYIRTFYLDDTVYSVQYLDWTQNEETGDEREKIFDSVDFKTPKSIKNQMSNQPALNSTGTFLLILGVGLFVFYIARRQRKKSKNPF